MNEVQTRDKILQTAFRLFLERGYENTPVQTIIDEVGIAKGTFYHHFKGKEEMLVAAIEAMSHRVVEKVRTVVEDPQLNAIEKMLAASRQAAGQKMEDIGPSTVFLIRQMRLPSNWVLAGAIERISTQWIRPFYLTMIRQGVAEGVFHVQDAEMTCDLYIGLALSSKNQVSDLFLAAVEGTPGAQEKLLRFYHALEQGLERLLGAPEGSLPIYSSINIPELFARLGAMS